MYNFKSLKIYLLLFLCISINSCTASKNSTPAEKNSMLQKIYVESVDSKNIISKQDALEVKVAGNLPSPAYTFDHFDVKVKGKVIEISPLAKYDANKMVMQVLVPFEEVYLVKDLKPGTYEIKVVGRGDTILSKKNVQVRNRK